MTLYACEFTSIIVFEAVACRHLGHTSSIELGSLSTTTRQQYRRLRTACYMLDCVRLLGYLFKVMDRDDCVRVCVPQDRREEGRHVPRGGLRRVPQLLRRVHRQLQCFVTCARILWNAVVVIGALAANLDREHDRGALRCSGALFKFMFRRCHACLLSFRTFLCRCF